MPQDGFYQKHHASILYQGVLYLEGIMSFQATFHWLKHPLLIVDFYAKFFKDLLSEI
jgi:hypothetical protein